MENSTPLVTTPPPTPTGCICAYTWHQDGDGRIVRNGPLEACAADHSTVDGDPADARAGAQASATAGGHRQ